MSDKNFYVVLKRISTEVYAIIQVSDSSNYEIYPYKTDSQILVDESETILHIKKLSIDQNDYYLHEDVNNRYVTMTCNSCNDEKIETLTLSNNEFFSEESYPEDNKRVYIFEDKDISIIEDSSSRIYSYPEYSITKGDKLYEVGYYGSGVYFPRSGYVMTKNGTIILQIGENMYKLL